ncbi:uncharacterized protein [Amphiura filiformis]|uniref:uncharacterized protein n=1 Tax=Amphiura filiformis TaxID=82378 RepID=UPI003B20EC38
MPQVFMVTSCYACSVFQVQQVKKVPKWVCKMCGEKQSLKKEYGRGSGADCRKHVQKLNLLKVSVENDIPAETHPVDQDVLHNHYDDENDEECYEQAEEPFQESNPGASMWGQFINDPDEEITHELEPQTFPDFDVSRITTDADTYKSRGRRGNRGWTRGNTGSGGRKRKLNKDNYFEEDYSEQVHSASSTGGHHEYSSGELWGKKQGTAKQSHCNYGNTQAVKKSSDTYPNPEPSNSNGRWNNFLNEENSSEDKRFGFVKEKMSTKSLSKPTQSSATSTSSSKWGQFLENAESTEEYSQESRQDDVERSLSSQQQEQGSISGSFNHRYLGNDEEWVTADSDDKFRLNDNNMLRSSDSLPESMTNESLSQILERESGDSIGEQEVDSLQGSSRWNVFLSSQSNRKDKAETDLMVNQSELGKMSQNISGNLQMTSGESKPYQGGILQTTGGNTSYQSGNLQVASGKVNLTRKKQVISLGYSLKLMETYFLLRNIIWMKYSQMTGRKSIERLTL